MKLYAMIRCTLGAPLPRSPHGTDSICVSCGCPVQQIQSGCYGWTHVPWSLGFGI